MVDEMQNQDNVPLDEAPGARASAPAVKPSAIKLPPATSLGEKGDDVAHEITFLNEIEVTATVELGRTSMPIREVLKLRRGSVLELDKLVGQPADLLVNNTTMAKGEVIVINERFGFRITKFITPPT